MPRVLVADDDPSIRRTLEKFLGSEGFDVVLADDGPTAEARVRDGDLDIVLLDLGLPGKDGLEVLESLAASAMGPPIVVVSGLDGMDATGRAIQHGAYDYLLKPIDVELLMSVMTRALDEQEVRRRLSAAGTSDDGLDAERDSDQLMAGRTASMRQVFKRIAQVSNTRATVLITGESGTGKELVARAIHQASDARDEPFVAVNCAALAPGLLESELFGHAQGAFTGAVAQRAGRLEIAGKGTILLDEIGELATDLQAKLLRVVQERVFERVGESKSRPMLARVLAATHRDLRAEVAAGRFREDLLYRLSVVEIAIPALRERLEDLPVLIQRLLGRVERELGRTIRAVAPDALVLLERHRWPGNVRELYNVLQRAAVLARGDVITQDLIGLAGLTAGGEPAGVSAPTRLSLAEVERAHIVRVLRQTGWHKRRAAESLGISRPTLDRKIRNYQLSPPDESDS